MLGLHSSSDIKQAMYDIDPFLASEYFYKSLQHVQSVLFAIFISMMAVW